MGKKQNKLPRKKTLKNKINFKFSTFKGLRSNQNGIVVGQTSP